MALCDSLCDPIRPVRTASAPLLPGLMAGRGRPTLFRSELCARARDHCRRGATLSQLADLLGVAPRSIDNWIARFPDFAAAVREGRAVADAEVDRMLYQRAIGYSQTVERPVRCRGRIEIVPYTRHHRPDARACMRWLCRQLPQDWRRRPHLAPTAQDPAVNRAHQFGREAIEVISALHALAMGYQQTVERIMVCRGEPLVVSYTRHHTPHVRAGTFWMSNRLPQEWSHQPRHQREMVSPATSAPAVTRAHKFPPVAPLVAQSRGTRVHALPDRVCGRPPACKSFFE